MYFVCLYFNTTKAEVRYSHGSKYTYWAATLRIWEYLKGSGRFSIGFQRASSLELGFFADASNANEAAGRGDVPGGVMINGRAAVNRFSITRNLWRFPRPNWSYGFVWECSGDSCLETVWCFMSPGTPCLKIIENNQGALQLMLSPLTTLNSKHIDIEELLHRRRAASTSAHQSNPFAMSARAFPKAFNISGDKYSTC